MPSGNGGNRASPLGAFVGSNPTVYTILTDTERHVMKKAFIGILAVLVAGSVVAGGFDDDPYAIFNASKRMTSKANIEWKLVDDPVQECQKESKRRGLGGFKGKVYACTFWDEGIRSNTCTIITGKETNMHQLGHEVRHCFAGAFH